MPEISCAYASTHQLSQTALSALMAEGIHPIPLQDTIDALSEIKSSDFLVAVLDRDPTSPVLIEIGMALGARRPVLLLSERAELIPIAIRHLPAILLEKLSEGDLRLQLRAFVHPLVKSKSQMADRRGTTDLAREIRARPRMRQSHSEPTPKRKEERNRSSRPLVGDLETEVAWLLEAAGGTVVAQDLGPKRLDVPDLAATFPSLGPTLGTVLIELAGLRPELGHKITTLAKAVEDRGVLFGILVTADEPASSRQASDRVLVLSIARLRNLVDSSSLQSELVRMRNRVIHGVS